MNILNSNINEKKISVIICTDKRKDYIIEATRSADSQTFKREEYEIIVVKRFFDKLIDEQLESLCDSLLYVESDWQGQKWLEAINKSRGKLLCFLDDDDVFSRFKLEMTWDNYTKYNFKYMRNNMLPFGENLPQDTIKPLGITLNILPEKKVVKKSKLIAKKTPKISSSTTTIERDLCLKYEGLIKNSKITFDTLCFYIALDSGCEITLDTSILTFYRIHNSFTGTPNIISALDVYLEDYENIGTKLQNETLKLLLRNDVFTLKLLKFIFKTDQRPRFSDFMHFTVFSTPGRMRLKLFFMLLYFVSFIRLKTAMNLYIKLNHISKESIK